MGRLFSAVLVMLEATSNAVMVSTRENESLVWGATGAALAALPLALWLGSHVHHYFAALDDAAASELAPIEIVSSADYSPVRR